MKLLLLLLVAVDITYSSHSDLYHAPVDFLNGIDPFTGRSSGGHDPVERKENPVHFRLPEGILPEKYNLRITALLEDGNFTFKGDVKIKISAQNTTDSITLHSKRLAISEPKLLEDGTQSEVAIQGTEIDEGRDFYIINLKEPLEIGKTYSVSMKFKGKLNDDLNGFYKSFYKDGEGKTQWLAVTQFAATHARKAFPCFDEPSLKANFTVSIGRHVDMSSLSNMQRIGTTEHDQDLPPNYVWDHYTESPKMSTYLVAFVISKFKSKKVGNFEVWSRGEAVNQVDYSLTVGPKALDIMHNITGIKYALPKVDMVAIPDFEAGAMENWGLITFRETALLFEEGVSGPKNRQRVATVVTHELAHQWFGNLVSPKWWKFTWLNEGFATFFECAATDFIEPSWRLMEQFVILHHQRAFFVDAFPTHPMTFDFSNPRDISSVFDEISYSKGGSVIRMMEHFLTREAFFKGLQRYLSNRQYNSGSDVQLFEALDVQAKLDGAISPDVDVKKIMNTWTKQIGYPIVTVSRNYNNDIVHLTQERFVYEKETKPKHRLWWVPITFTTQSEVNFKNTAPSRWMSVNETSFQINGLNDGSQWLILNLQESGFYRVNYDENNWRLITQYLNSPAYHKIHPLNRAQLIDDSLNLARGGYLNYSLALDLMSYMAQETDFIPWYAVYQSLAFLDARLGESEEYSKFKMHVLHLIQNHYNELNFTESPTDAHLTHMSRSMLLPWACKYQHRQCLEQASKMFSEWKNGQIQTVPANLKGTVYCHGVSTSGTENWKLLWEKYQKTTVATEQSLIMGALGCSKDKATLVRYLEMAIEDDSGIRPQDRMSVFYSVYGKPGGLDVTLDFLIANFQEMKNKLGVGSIGSLIRGISSILSSKKQAIKMKYFLMSNAGEHGGAQASIKQSIQVINNNMKWIEKYVPVIEDWLKRKYSPTHANK